jgi:hypothetical protein
MNPAVVIALLNEFLGLDGSEVYILPTKDLLDWPIQSGQESSSWRCQRRFVSGVAKVRTPGKQEIPEPADDEAIVFVHYFRAGLWLPYDEMVIKVLKHFKVYLHQLTPNAIVRMSLFAWAARSEGVKASPGPSPPCTDCTTNLSWSSPMDYRARPTMGV